MRKAAAKNTQETTQTKKTTKQDDSFTIRIPRLSFKNNSLNMYLVFTIVIFAFILGMLTNKILYLESKLKSDKVAAAQPTQAAQPLRNEPPQIVNVDNGHLAVLGKTDAKVTIVEFSDFQCPFCDSFYTDTLPQLKEKYIDTGKVQLYYRHFPLNSIHPNAQRAALASECANAQNKFWDYHDILFKNQETWSPQTLSDATNSFVDYAGQLGMSTDEFRSCLESERQKKGVEDDIAAANKAQVDGTPAFFINGYRLTGAQPFSEFETIIEQELKK